MLIPEVDGVSELWMSDLSGVNAPQFKLDFFAPASSFGASDDLRRFAFVREEHPAGWVLYLTDEHGENRRRVVESKQRVANPTFSPDGKHIAYLDPEGSAKNVSLIRTNEPGTPMTFTVSPLPHNVRAIHWIEPERFVVYSSSRKSFLCSVRGGEPTPFFEDSTWARPILGGKQMVYRDFRNGREGQWIVALNQDGKATGGATRFLSPEANAESIPSADGCTWVYQKHPGQWWKMTLPTRKEERVSKRPPLAFYFFDMLGGDGTRLAYLIDRVTMKLMLLENVFE